MSRTIKEEEHAVRRNEILDVTRRLIYTKGYEQMTVQDVLDELKISKGAFYHYFHSKQDLMECEIERIIDEGLRYLMPIVEDETLPALEKLQRYFDSAVRWKTARKAEMLALLRVWYADENAIVRQKVFSGSTTQFAPALVKIVRQGMREGVFHPAYPELVGEVLLALMQGFGENFSKLFLQPDPGSLDQLMTIVGGYTDAMERILGIPAGSLTLIDADTMRVWLAPESIPEIPRQS
jgi:AcrR family transcriptional regulator